MTESAMELMNVKKTIGSKDIIKGLTFTINKGEVFGLIGPNGAGKTTTIRMMVGLMRLSAGDVRILGKSIKSDFKEAVRQVGVIVENPELYPFMSGWQNLKHFARMIPGITDERIHEVVKLLGMEKPIKEKVGKYSLGMRQRLGIAQALLHAPSVLILDEPTNGLDPAGIREIRTYIRPLASKEEVSVINSSPLLSEIELMCDRIDISKNGEPIATEFVRGAEEQENVQQVVLEVTPACQAIELLNEKLAIEASAKDGALSFQCEKERIPTIIQTLVQHDMAVYQVGLSNDTLEDKFFDLIGENTIE